MLDKDFNAVIVSIILIVLSIIAIVLLRWYLDTKAKLKKMLDYNEQALSEVNMALSKRLDIIQIQFEIATEFTNGELNNTVSAIELRKDMTVEELESAETQMEEVQERIDAVAESYNELISNKYFLAIQKKINDCELEICATKRAYNTSITFYNDEITAFPTSVIAKLMKCKKATSFEIVKKQSDEFQIKIYDINII